MLFHDENYLPDAAVGTLTFYHQQVVKIRESCYYRDHIYDQLIRAKKFIDKHYSRDIDINAIAREAFFSKYHFIRLFRNAYGSTPHQYLRAVRIEQAKKLLQTHTTITDVCHSVGFNSLSSFTGLFRKITGFTPTAYRTQQKKQF